VSLSLSVDAQRYIDELVRREGRCHKGEHPIANDTGATGRKRNMARLAAAAQVSIETIRKMRGDVRVRESVARKVVSELNGDYEYFRSLCQ
jgi:DNA-binding phage protein